MKHFFLFNFLLLFVWHMATAQVPKVASGRVQRFDQFASKYVTARTVDVWLPDGYTLQKQYAVLYMHDGNSLFDSSIVWNHQEWGVDETAQQLMKDSQIREIIVVGIWNGGSTRHADYFPQKPYEGLDVKEKEFVTQKLQEKGRVTAAFQPVSDNYLKFLVKELKPFVDSTFSTKTDQKNTFIAGSSMGALISLYAICEYPEVFGGAACLSTHWPGIFSLENNPVPAAFVRYLQQHLPDPKQHKIYFDYGDQTLDALYPSLQKKVDKVLKKKGYSRKNWITKFFPGANHSEVAWAKRLAIPFVFLLKK